MPAVLARLLRRTRVPGSWSRAAAELAHEPTLDVSGLVVELDDLGADVDAPALAAAVRACGEGSDAVRLTPLLGAFAVLLVGRSGVAELRRELDFLARSYALTSDRAVAARHDRVRTTLAARTAEVRSVLDTSGALGVLEGLRHTEPTVAASLALLDAL